MHNFILHRGDSIVYEHSEDKHGYKIYLQSPLGKALKKAKERGEGTIVLLSDLPNQSSQSGPFSKLQSRLQLNPVLNVGKEWVFRSLFSLGDECVGEDTLNTNQAFQTRLQWTGDSFKIHTQVSGCKDKEHKAYLVPHEFCFKEHTGGEMHNTGPKMMKQQAQQKFIDEIINYQPESRRVHTTQCGYNFF